MRIILSGNVDFEGLFELIHRRLRAPEWEMRQNALRVLKDIIPLLEPDLINEKVEKLLNDIITNLGHSNPGVRKAAVDCLRSFLAKNPLKADEIVKDLIQKSTINPAENLISQDVCFGIVLALPFLLTHVEYDTIKLVIHSLLDNLNKVTDRDITVRSLLRIKEKLGGEVFKEHLKNHWRPNASEEFETICQLHGLTDKTGTLLSYGDNPDDEREFETRLVKYERRPESADVIVSREDRVILETEIRLRSGSAITMKIHEESRIVSRESSLDSQGEGR